jgi:hypothetical protein
MERSIDKEMRWIINAIALRRLRRHRAWCRRNRVVYWHANPAADHRRWSDAYMKSLRQ